MNTNIASLYQFTLQQMAAESYFEGVGVTNAAGIRKQLLLGANREGYKTGPADLNEGYPGYTRMTSVMADEFLKNHSIVHQWSDTHTYIGDQRAKLIGTETLPSVGPNDPGYGTYAWGETSWAADGALTGGKPEVDFNDVITASADADTINGKGGNDALDGKAGNDQIDGGEGDDLIGGGTGSDTIQGGAGNDIIFGATSLTVKQREGSHDTWTPPSGQTVIAQGSNWGYALNPATQAVNYAKYLSSVTPDTDGDMIDAGAALAGGLQGSDVSRCKRAKRRARFAMHSIAGYAYSAGAGGRFDVKKWPSTHTVDFTTQRETGR